MPERTPDTLVRELHEIYNRAQQDQHTILGAMTACSWSPTEDAAADVMHTELSRAHDYLQRARESVSRAIAQIPAVKWPVGGR